MKDPLPIRLLLRFLNNGPLVLVLPVGVVLWLLVSDTKPRGQCERRL